MPKIAGTFISKDNLLLTISAAVVSSIGFMYNDFSVILGSMLISPLGKPVIQCMLAVYLGNYKESIYGLLSFLILSIVSISIGFIMSELNRYLEYYYTVPTDKMEQLISDKFLVTNFIIGCFTGFFIAYAIINNNIGVLHGFSLVVAIVPPLVNSGLYASLAYQNKYKNNQLYREYKKNSINSFKIAFANACGLGVSLLIGFIVFCNR